MIKQCILGLAIASLLAGCGDDQEQAARDKIGAVKTAFDARNQGTPNANGTSSLSKADINQCVADMTRLKTDLETIQKEFAVTQAVQAIETQALYGKVRGQLASCQQTKARLGW